MDSIFAQGGTGKAVLDDRVNWVGPELSGTVSVTWSNTSNPMSVPLITLSDGGVTYENYLSNYFQGIIKITDLYYRIVSGDFGPGRFMYFGIWAGGTDQYKCSILQMGLLSMGNFTNVIRQPYDVLHWQYTGGIPSLTNPGVQLRFMLTGSPDWEGSVQFYFNWSVQLLGMNFSRINFQNQ